MGLLTLLRKLKKTEKVPTHTDEYFKAAAPEFFEVKNIGTIRTLKLERCASPGGARAVLSAHTGTGCSF